MFAFGSGKSPFQGIFGGHQPLIDSSFLKLFANCGNIEAEGAVGGEGKKNVVFNLFGHHHGDGGVVLLVRGEDLNGILNQFCSARALIFGRPKKVALNNF